MNGRSLRVIASCLTMSHLFVGAIEAQERVPPDSYAADIQRRFSSHITTIRGAESPELIPFAEKMSVTFNIFAIQGKEKDPATFRQSIQESLGVTSGSATTLQKEFNDDHLFRKSAAAISTDGMRSICDDVNAQGAAKITAARIASRMEDIKRKRQELTEAHYRNIIDQLPATDRQALVDYSERQAVNMTYGRMDNIAIAADIPEIMEAKIQANCSSVDDRPQGKEITTPLGEHFSVTRW